MAFTKHIHDMRRRESEHCPSLTQAIEKDTTAPVTISTSLTPTTLSKCHLQTQSPLFHLPAEIREMVFTSATAPYYVEDSLLAANDIDYRSDHPGRPVVSTELLATCRRIWLEANHLPMQQAHHCYFLPQKGWRRTVPGEATARLDAFATSLTRNNRPLFTHLHIFANLRYFTTHTSYILPSLLRSMGACPEVLTLTARHVDWPDWRNDQFLARWSPSDWLPGLLSYQASPRLREIRLELETLDFNIDRQLRSIVADLRERFAHTTRVDELGNQVSVELQSPPPPEKAWTGPVDLAGGDWPWAAGTKQLNYRIITLVWKVERVEEGGADAGFQMPIVEFSDADTLGQGALGPNEVAAKKEWEERWEREGSLLRFAE